MKEGRTWGRQGRVDIVGRQEEEEIECTEKYGEGDRKEKGRKWKKGLS